MKSEVRHLLFLFLLICICTCANQGFPPGGPVDNTPPQIVSTYPEPNSLNVTRRTNVELEFTEKIDSRSVQNAIFISPNPGDRFEVKVKGKRLSIKFQDSLIVNVTYTITLGTGIKDLRGNGLVQSYTLAFSTGKKLDHKQISGQVFFDKPEDVSVWAYILESDSDVDPTQEQPQYITQCGSDGKFRFSNLAPRMYRLFAVADQNRNRTYQIGREFIGVTSNDINLQGEKEFIQNRNFKLAKHDTSRIRILQIEQQDQRHIRVRFSRPVLPNHSEENHLNIKDKSGEEVGILDLAVNSDDKSIWSLTTIPRDSGNHQLIVHSVYNEFRELITDSVAFEFLSIITPDTSRPAIFTINPDDSSKAVLQNLAFKIKFSESVDSTDSNLFFAFFEDSVEFNDYRIEWKNLSEINITPDCLWTENTWYHCVVDTNKVKDFAGNILNAKKNKFSWKIVNPDTLSSISGKISDEDSLAKSIIVLELWEKPEKVSYKISITDTGKYEFPQILPGSFTIQGFRDSDKNGIYSFGKVQPFLPAERFFVGQDTILVRSRWPNEGNNYQFKK